MSEAMQSAAVRCECCGQRCSDEEIERLRTDKPTWWIGDYEGQRKWGPFVSMEMARLVRTQIEMGRDKTYWIWNERGVGGHR